MEERMLDLMEKLYIEMQKGFSELRSDMSRLETELRSDMSRLETELKGDIIRLENKMDNNHKALFDGYIQCYEGIKRLEMKFEELSAKVDKQEVEIKVIKSAK